MPLDERPARARGVLAVVTEAARPLRLGNLHDPVHQIAGEDGLPGLRPEPDADVTGSMARRGLEAEPRVDRVAGGDHPGPPRPPPWGPPLPHPPPPPLAPRLPP